MAVALCVGSGITAPTTPAARGDAPPTIAVFNFENDAGAPSAAVTSLSTALFSAVVSSPRYRAVGGGPLPLGRAVNGDVFGAALDSAAKSHAEHMMLGDLVKLDGGRAYYRLSAYRVNPLTIIRSRVFSQAYPPADARALSAGFASDVATLEAPRTSTGTIWAVSGGVRADLGTAEGFHLGQRFNVVRNGQKVAEAQISHIEDSEATLSFSNVTGSYRPEVGDRLIGIEPAPAVLPPPAAGSGFNPIALLIAAGAAVVAASHKSAPQGPPVLPSPSPSSGSAFTIVSASQSGPKANPTLQFTFSKSVAQTATQIGSSTSFAVATYMPPGPSTPFSLSAFCSCAPTFVDAPTNQVLQIIVGTPPFPLAPNQVVTFSFTSAITDTAIPSDALTPVVFSYTAAIASLPLGAGANAGLGPLRPAVAPPVGPPAAAQPPAAPNHPKPDEPREPKNPQNPR